MADTKISALTASTTPLAGTEVLPIVQSGVTKQVSVDNLTAGRAISATQLTLTAGNLIVANGQGIDFSATPGTGTSELLSDYEEGTWTPVFTNLTTVTGTPVAAGIYVKIGSTVYFRISITGGTSSSVANSTRCTVPFTASGNHVCVASDANTVGNFGTGLIQGVNIFTPSWTAIGVPVITGTYTI
jgi:hypothetical protein